MRRLGGSAPALKAVYSASELGEMAGLSRHQVGRMLDDLGIRNERPGAKRRVYLSTLRNALPDLWDSLVLKAQLEGGK